MSREEEVVDIESLARQYNVYSKEESKAKYAKNSIRNRLMDFMKSMNIPAGEEVALAEDVTISYSTPVSLGTIQRDLLLAEGVSMATILKCTKKPEVPSDRINVRVKKEKSDETPTEG